MKTDFFNAKVSFNLTDDQYKRVNEVVKSMPGIYENNSHFFRCAVIKLLHEQERFLKDHNLMEESKQ